MAKNTGKWAIGAVLAGLTGYIAGILTAPKSGKETRKDIKKTAQHTMTQAERKLKELHSQLAVLIKEAKKQTEGLQAKAKVELNKLLDSAVVAKEKARAVLSALHEGDADDRDLDKAVKEVNDAVKHLKTYLQKNGTITK